MVDNPLITELVNSYYASRPNLQTAHKPLCIFFISCSGAGKSTIRKELVNKLDLTYVCNDEVRMLLAHHPDKAAKAIELKEIVSRTWGKIMTDSPNKTVVFDNNIIQYYGHSDSYINVARKLNIPIFVVDLPRNVVTLKRRIITRNIDVEHLLGELPGQLNDYARAKSDIKADWILEEGYSDADMEKLIHAIEAIA